GSGDDVGLRRVLRAPRGRRLSGPRGARGQRHTGRVRLGASWGGETRTGPPGRHPPGLLGSGRSASLGEEREPGTPKTPGWFVNRTLKVALNGPIVHP